MDSRNLHIDSAFPEPGHKEFEMAEIKPFRGFRYNSNTIDDPSKVVTPPYDVISRAEQDAFHECHPHNVIRLILGKPEKGDRDKNDWHARAATRFTSWVDDGILVRDPEPSFYLTTVKFPIEGQTVTRHGLIGLVRLEPFDKGVVLPHERTFSKVKSERLSLMQACHTNFSPIFSLFSDPENILEPTHRSITKRSAEMELVDTYGHHHQLWSISDSDFNAKLRDFFLDKRLFIADGHHRYETALNYRNWIAENTEGFSENHPANFVMMYLCRMEDPGLVILPAHRILNGISDESRSTFLQKVSAHFEIKTISFGTNDMNRQAALTELIKNLQDHEQDHSLGVFIKNQQEFHLLTLKPGEMDRVFENQMAPALKQLDVNVLTQLIFVKVLGFDQNRLDNETLISYSSTMPEAIDRVASGDHDMCFLLNPTRINQVRSIAEEGLTMPRKATYFYPKTITGQVLNSLRP